MATYYKVTNTSARSGKSGRAIFLVEAGKLLKPGETAYNLRRVSNGTLARSQSDGSLEILQQGHPYKDPTTPVPAKSEPPKVKHIVHEAPPMPEKKEEAAPEPPPAPSTLGSWESESASEPAAAAEPEPAPEPEPEKKSSSSPGGGKRKRGARKKKSSDE